jgi:uncharacterized membrane protein YtjA (UPF0391 family)
MLQYPATFLIIAILAAFLGFGAMAGLIAEIARVLFFVSMGLFFCSFVFNGPTPRN